MLDMSDGKLTNEQRQNFADWMNSRAPLIGKCGLCGHREWAIASDILEVRPFHGGGLAIGGSVYPYIGVVCQHCGNTHFVNAVISNVLQETKSDSTPEELSPSSVSDD